MKKNVCFVTFLFIFYLFLFQGTIMILKLKFPPLEGQKYITVKRIKKLLPTPAEHNYSQLLPIRLSPKPPSWHHPQEPSKSETLFLNLDSQHQFDAEWTFMLTTIKKPHHHDDSFETGNAFNTDTDTTYCEPPVPKLNPIISGTNTQQPP